MGIDIKVSMDYTHLTMTGKYEKLGKEIGELVDAKNKAYGDSFNQVGKFLEILYPDGIPVENYSDALCIVRIFDKLKRIATNKDALGEDPYRDLVGYGLLGVAKNLEQAPEQQSQQDCPPPPRVEDLKILKG